ncbi:MAG: hypothetical protein C4288_08190 [Leptolyngbya sp. ERB_1_1]
MPVVYCEKIKYIRKSKVVKKHQNFPSLHRFIKSPERAFLILSLIFGMMFIIALAPFQSPDEPAHFYRAYQLSEGKIIG